MTSSPLNPSCGRRPYLITYSQADEQRFPTRESFANIVLEEFNRRHSAVKVSHYACCRKLHQEGGFHYHCAVKLTGNKKWISVKTRLAENHNIVVNFSDKHNFYISAYRYLCKQGNNVGHSQGHPNLAEAKSPRTKKSIESNQAATKKKTLFVCTFCKNSPKEKAFDKFRT